MGGNESTELGEEQNPPGPSLSSAPSFSANLFSEQWFAEHLELLRWFLARREDIVSGIQDLLNAQRKPLQYLRDRVALSLQFEDVFFSNVIVSPSQALLRGQLEQAHAQGGFQPRPLQGMENDLIHPAEMMMRGFHFWHRTRWPGRNGRRHYAQTLFNVYLLRHLQLLSLHVWDPAGEQDASARLAEMQAVLNELWSSSPADQPVMVRDARWLIPLAQSLPTDALAPYLEVAQLVAETLSQQDALEVQRAQVRMLGGHLTSQIRHLCMKDQLSIDDPAVVVRTRTSNALDFALLMQGLVPLLKAYEEARNRSDETARLVMAGAICQGISPDPELFLHRVPLLRAYSMMEHVFVAADFVAKDFVAKDAKDGPIGCTPLGRRHVDLLNEYETLLRRLIRPLAEDHERWKPANGGYSPYGVVFGYPSNLIELMALKTLQREAETRFSLEDVFVDATQDQERLAWVDGWRKMPHIDPAMQQLYAYPQQFAEEIYDRVQRELEREDISRSKIGHLFLVSANVSTKNIEIPELPRRYFTSTDEQIAGAGKAAVSTQSKLLHERQEGHFLVSYETSGGWVALSKDLLTEVLGAGRDTRITGLPPDAVQVLQLMCGELAEGPT